MAEMNPSAVKEEVDPDPNLGNIHAAFGFQAEANTEPESQDLSSLMTASQ